MNLTEIKNICDQLNIVPTKSRGQNFLFDENIVKKIIASANLAKNDLILEIGPGLGVLTDDLVKSTKQVKAVELDKKIISFLKNKYADQKNLEIIEGDVLKIDVDATGFDQSYKIVANLPYNITSNFIRKFLEAVNPPKEMVIMIQKEVAKRIVAKKGEMSMLSVAVQFYAEPEILFEVSRNSFWPSPKVDSAVIKIKLKSLIDADRNADKPEFADAKLFFRVLKMGFSAKRKQLQNNLANGLHLNKEKTKEIIKSVGLDEKIRPQDLGVEDWVNICKNISNFE